MILTFLGTKGGTGTTTMAVNCAADIRRLSGRPTLVADVKQAGDVALFLGLRPRHTLADLLEQVAWSEPDLARRFVTEHDCGLEVLAAADGYSRPNARDAEGVEEALRNLAGFYEYLVVDAGSALTESAVAALALSDLVILVANPDVPCLRNLQRLTDTIRLDGVGPERLRIVLNRAADTGVIPVQQIEDALARTIDFRIPSDYRTVASALNAGVPLSGVRGSEMHQQVDSMARTLIGWNVTAVAS